MLDLTVSIVNHKNKALLKALLESIANHTEDIAFQVYVVDNASGDGSVEMVRQAFPWVNLICNERPEGFASNHNKVLGQTQSRYAVLLNDDMLLLNNALGHMIAFLDDHPQAGAAGCMLLNPDHTVQRSCWVGFPSAQALLIDLLYLSQLLPQCAWVREREPTLTGATQPIQVDHLLGACITMRRETVDRVGMLDESYVMFLEETDWCYRIKEDRWQIYWVPQGRIMHYGQQSIRGDPERFLPMLYRNYVRFGRQHGATIHHLLATKAIIMFGALLRSGLWAFRSLRKHPDARAMLAGYLGTLRRARSF